MDLVKVLLFLLLCCLYVDEAMLDDYVRSLFYSGQSVILFDFLRREVLQLDKTFWVLLLKTPEEELMWASVDQGVLCHNIGVWASNTEEVTLFADHFVQVFPVGLYITYLLTEDLLLLYKHSLAAHQSFLNSETILVLDKWLGPRSDFNSAFNNKDD